MDIILVVMGGVMVQLQRMLAEGKRQSPICGRQEQLLKRLMA